MGTPRNPFFVLDEEDEQQRSPDPQTTPVAQKPSALAPDNPFRALEADDQSQQSQMRITQRAAQETTPDRRAEAMRIAAQSGLPVETVERRFEELKKQYALEGKPYEEIQRRAPHLAAWLTDPNNAALTAGQDELERMGALEWILKAPGRAFAQSLNRMRYAELRTKSMFSTLSREEQDAMETYKFQINRDGNLGVKDSFFAKAWTGAAKLLGQATEPAKYGLVGGLGGAGIGAAGGSIVPGVGTLAGAGTGFTTGARAGVMYGVTKSTGMMEAAETYDELLEMRDENGQPIDPGIAKVAAITVGGINGLVEQVGLSAFLKRFPGLDKLTAGGGREAIKKALLNPTVRAGFARLAKNYASGVSIEVATEVAQRGITIVGEEAAKIAAGPGFDAERRSTQDVWDDLVDTAVESTAEFALGMAPGPVMQFAQDVQRAKSASQAVTFFTALGENVAENPLATRMPSAFQRYVEEATESGPVKELYQSTDGWIAYWQAQGEDPKAMATAVTGRPDALDVALQSGTLVIPTARYAATLAGSEHNAYFVNELRLGDPLAMNGREAEEFKTRVDEVKQRIADEKARQTPEGAAIEDIKATVIGQLSRAGVSRETAATMAEFAGGIGNLVQRAGFDAREAFAGYGLDVQRRLAQDVTMPEGQATPAGMLQREPGKPPATPAEEIPGLAALEADLGTASISQLDPAAGFVENASGESAASGEALSRGAGMRARGEQFVVYDRAGRRRVLSAVDGVDYRPAKGETYGVESPQGFSLREDNGGRVPAAPVESRLGQQLGRVFGQATSLPAVPSGKRIEGEPGEANAAGVRAVFIGYQSGYGNMPTHALYNIEGGELDGSTVGVERLVEQEIPIPPTPPLLEYNQRNLATSAPLRQWFGDSVVVDEDGAPLVVYHGTTRVFTTFDSEQANPESDFGAGFYFSNNPDDIGANYASIGPDLQGKLERRTEQLQQEIDDSEEDVPAGEAERRARAELVEHDGVMMPVFLKIERPAVLGGENETQLTMELVEDEAGDIIDEKGTLVEFVMALRNAGGEFYDFEPDDAITKLMERGYDGLSLREAIEILRSDEKFGYVTDDVGNLVSNEVIRRAIENAGYDGIIDHTVDIKFGSQRRIGKAMAGMDEDTVHYIVFEPTQIKSAVGNRGTFDPTTPDILYQSAIEPSPASNVFWSKLTRTVQESKQNTGTGAQWKGIIKNSKIGSNKDEFAIAKIEDLDDKAKYSKAELLAYIEQNQPRVNLVVLGEESDEDYDPDDDPEAELDEDEVRERADEIHSRMVDEAMNDIDWDDYVGTATYEEEEIEDEEEVEVQETDEDGNLVFDDDGDPVMTTETQTTTRTVYYPAISGGMYREGRGRVQHRRGTQIIPDAEPYDTEEEAERAAEAYRDEQMEDDYIRERVYESVSEGVEYSDAVEEAERELRDEGHARPSRESGNLGTRYGDYQLEPPAESGTYREIFLTASNVSSGEVLEGPDQIDLARSMFGVGDYNALDDLQKAVVDAAYTNHQKARKIDYEWKDGHDKYKDIPNPIVRIRLNVREALGEKLEPEPIEPSEGEKNAMKLGDEAKVDLEALRVEVVARLNREFREEGKKLYRDQDFEIADDTPWTSLRSTMTPSEFDRYDSLTKDIAAGADAKESFDRYLARNQNRRAPGERVLFIEEIQPPRLEEQGKMPPIFLKNWRELAFKFILRYAVDQGFSTVAWVTGQQQADHWSLEHKVRSIVTTVTREDSPAGTAGVNRVVQINLPSGSSPVLDVNAKGVVIGVRNDYSGRWEEQLKDQPLGAITGDELAEKIMAHAVEATEENSNALTLEGKGLRVGGRGLKRLYDFDFKNVVKGLPAFKAHGGKVGEVTINAEVKWHIENPDEVTDDELAKQGHTRPNAGTHFVMDNSGKVIAMFDTRDAAWDYVHANKRVDSKQPAIFISPEVATAVQGGQALFQAGRYRPTTAEEKEAMNAQLDAVVKAAEAAAPPGSDLSAFVTTTGEIYLASIMVPPGAQGQGAGTKMLQAVLDFADEHNMQVSLRQDPDRGKKTALRRFYSRAGFVKNGTSRFYDASSQGSWVRPAIASRGKQVHQTAQNKGPRGSIQFHPNRKVTISLFEHADLSTFLHETGHFYLELFGDLVDKLDALDPTTLTASQLQVKADYATILQHLGVANRTELTVKEHELFARSFETYLMEGKAPSLALREAFARVRAWFVGIYRSLKALNAPLSPDVRKVFDRLLASDEAISEAEHAGRLTPMFLTPEMAGMTHERFALYRQTIEEASAKATEELDQALMAEVHREQTAVYKERKKDVRAEVQAETYAMPVYKALAAMQRGKTPDGKPLVEGEEPTPLKLSKKLLVEQFGEAILKTLPKTIYSTEGGVAASVVAEQFGFDSGERMLLDIGAAPPMAKHIVAETEKRMLAEHGALMLDGGVHEAAQLAVANEKRDAVLREELRALARKRDEVKAFERGATKAAEAERKYERRWLEAEAKLRIAIAEGRQQVIIDGLQAEVTKMRAAARSGPASIRGAIPAQRVIADQARTAIAATKVQDLNPMLYWANAHRASRAATEAAARQDFDEAIRQKHRELISLALYRETVKAKQEVEKRVKAAKGIGTPQSMAKLRLAGETYHDQVAGVLDRFEFAEVSQTALNRRAALWRWVKGQESQGHAIDLPDEILDETRRVNYKQLTVEELVGVTDGLKQLVHLARFKNRLLKNERTRSLNKLAAQLDTSIRANKAAKPKGRRDRTNSVELGRMASGFFAAHRKLSSLLREIDGFVDGGPMWEAIMRPLNEAGAREADMNAQATRALHALIEKAYPKTKKSQLYARTYIPAISQSLSKMERIMFALNWGNAGNRDRVLNSEKWTPAQMQAVLDTLTESDAELVQGIFDFIGSYWQEIAAKQERVTGQRPERVEATPFSIGATELRGGYFPLKYDDRLSARADAMQDLEKANLAKTAAFTQATTRRGHTKARQESGDQPVRLDFGVIDEHVMQVIHDLTHHEALIDIQRVLGHNSVTKALMETHGDLVFKAIKHAVRDAAFGSIPAANGVERALNHTRAGVTVVGLAWSFTTPLMQLLGLANSTVRLRPKWMAKGLARAVGTPRSMTQTVEWIYESSPMMKTRGLTQQRELNDIRNTVGVYSGKLSSWMEEILAKTTFNQVSKQGIADSYFYMIGKMQQMVDVPTWLGAYEKAMAEGGSAEGDHERAVAIADQAVLDTQGGGQMKDLAAVQRGSAAFKIFTNFYTAGSVLYNQAVEVGKATRYTNAASIGRALTDYTMLFIIPASGAYFIREAMRPGDDDDELAEALARENLSYMVGMLVGFRELSGGIQDYFGYEGPAGARVFASANRVIKQVGQGELDEAALRAMNELAGILFHYPSSQVWKTANGIAALAEGRTQNPLVLITGPEK